MTESKASSGQATKTKSATNWPVIGAGVLCIVFIVGVWVNNYRVSHAAPVPVSLAAPK